MSNRHLAVPLALLVLAASAPAQILALREPARGSAVANPRAVSEYAARAFAFSLEDAMRRAAREDVFALFDHATLLERAMKGVPATDKVKKHFRDGARAGWNSDAGPLGSALAAVRAGGTFRWLTTSDVDGETWVAFRLTRADSGAPEYLEVALARRGEKGTSGVDVRSSSDGASHARVLRRWLLALVADAGRSLPPRIAGEDRAFALAGATFEEIDRSFEAGRNADALARWHELPAELRADPAVVLARLRAALAAGTSTFDAALAEARAAKVPGTSIELFAFDVAFATNRTGEALRALDALSAAGATDPYLDALRGSVLRDLGRAPEARAACRRALEADPHLEEAYWTLLGLAIEGQRHEEALTVLNQMDARFEIDWRGIESSPAYAAFLDSKPGQRWRTKFAGRR